MKKIEPLRITASWRTSIEKSFFFPTANNLLIESGSAIYVDVLSDINGYLRDLEVTVKRYFPSVVEGFE
jgi:hypothetical protein